MTAYNIWRVAKEGWEYNLFRTCVWTEIFLLKPILDQLGRVMVFILVIWGAYWEKVIGDIERGTPICWDFFGQLANKDA
jgi:hypothetical protein